MIHEYQPDANLSCKHVQYVHAEKMFMRGEKRKGEPSLSGRRPGEAQSTDAAVPWRAAQPRRAPRAIRPTMPEGADYTATDRSGLTSEQQAVNRRQFRNALQVKHICYGVTESEALLRVRDKVERRREAGLLHHLCISHLPHDQTCKFHSPYRYLTFRRYGG